MHTYNSSIITITNVNFFAVLRVASNTDKELCDEGCCPGIQLMYALHRYMM